MKTQQALARVSTVTDTKVSICCNAGVRQHGSNHCLSHIAPWDGFLNAMAFPTSNGWKM